MTEYERGFNEGFAAAIARIDRASGLRETVGREIGMASAKCIPVRVRPDQFKFISEHAAAVGISMAASVRCLIDRTMHPHTGKTENG